MNEWRKSDKRCDDAMRCCALCGSGSEAEHIKANTRTHLRRHTDWQTLEFHYYLARILCKNVQKNQQIYVQYARVCVCVFWESAREQKESKCARARAWSVLSLLLFLLFLLLFAKILTRAAVAAAPPADCDSDATPAQQLSHEQS